jgi:hypothetical protein
LAWALGRASGIERIAAVTLNRISYVATSDILSSVVIIPSFLSSNMSTDFSVCAAFSYPDTVSNLITADKSSWDLTMS